MPTEKFNVTTDTTDLEQMPKSTADAILANFKTTVKLKTGQPVRERAAQHDEQARYKASRSAAPLEQGNNEDDNARR